MSEPVYHLKLDAEVSRRKRWHHVFSEKGEHLYSSHKSSDCWTFLRVQEAKIVHIVTLDGTVAVKVEAYLPW